MQIRQRHLLSTLNLVVAFLEKYWNELEGLITPVARANLIACRDRLHEHMVAQEDLTRRTVMAIATQRALRRTLVRHHMREIVLVARARLGKLVLGSAEEAQERAAIVTSSSRRSYGRVVQAAYGLARAVKPHKDVFLAAGLREDFIERLVAAADALKDAIAHKGITVAARVAARSGLRNESRNGRALLRLLDTMMHGGLPADSDLLAEWRSTSHVRAVSASAVEAPSADDAPPAVAASVPVPHQPLRSVASADSMAPLAG